MMCYDVCVVTSLQVLETLVCSFVSFQGYKKLLFAILKEINAIPTAIFYSILIELRLAIGNQSMIFAV